MLNLPQVCSLYSQLASMVRNEPKSMEGGQSRLLDKGCACGTSYESYNLTDRELAAVPSDRVQGFICWLLILE